jgi:GDPmannose 4,6-dehydratase
MIRKKALIFGISGQDGSYLAKYLINKKYKVTGVCRRKRFINLKKLKIFDKINIQLIKNTETKKIKTILKKNFNEIYFLSGQSSVSDSFKQEAETYESQIKPLKDILDYIISQKIKKTKFLYAGSSELFGNINKKKRITEESVKKPISPYGLSKLIGYEIIKSYRKMYKIPVCTAIMFDHESPLRPKQFIFQKIINSLNQILKNKNHKLHVGDIMIKRDWGWGPDFMEACHKILNSKKIEDYIIATGKTVSLKKVINEYFKNHNLKWNKFTIIDKNFYRNFEIKENYANIKKIKKIINWQPSFIYPDIIKKLANEKNLK